jgi:hypothetical protein
MCTRTLFAAKCYWPGLTNSQLEQATGRARAEAEAAARAGATIAYLGAIFFPLDDLVLCVFKAEGQGDVRQASERAGMPCERVMQAVWLSGEGNERREEGIHETRGRNP